MKINLKSNNMIVSKKTTKLGLSSTLIAAILAVGLLTSIGMAQTNNAAAARNILLKERFRDSVAQVQATTTEGSIRTEALVTALTNPSRICVYMPLLDSNTGTILNAFFGCSPTDQLNIANGLGSATFSGTVTLNDYLTGQEKTVTVNADLTATGKVQTGNFGLHQVTQDFTFVSTAHGKFRPASGSLTITDANTSDVILSSGDAAGTIGKSGSGSIEVIRG
jgi:hypothetical protein